MLGAVDASDPWDAAFRLYKVRLLKDKPHDVTTVAVERRTHMLSTRATLAVLTMVVVSVTLTGQSPAPSRPSPEHERLAAFLGKWTFEGQAQASPYGPAGKLTSVDTFVWLPGNFFMEHQWDAKQGGTQIIGREIIGYDSTAKGYTSQFFDNAGNSGLLKATVNGNTWTWTADSVVAGKPLKERGTVVISGDTLTSRWEYSTDGAKWLPNFEQKATRSK